MDSKEEMKSVIEIPAGESQLDEKYSSDMQYQNHNTPLPDSPHSSCHSDCSEGDKSSRYASGKTKGAKSNNRKGNKLHKPRETAQQKWVVKSLQGEVNKLCGEKDALLQLRKDEREASNDDKKLAEEAEEREIVNLQMKSIPNISIVRSQSVELLAVLIWVILAHVYYVVGFLTLDWCAYYDMSILTYWREVLVFNGLVLFVSLMGFRRLAWFAPYTSLLIRPAPSQQTLDDVRNAAFKRPTLKAFLPGLIEYAMTWRFYTNIVVKGIYVTNHNLDARLTADKPCRINLRKQVLSVIELESNFQIKTVVVQNEMVSQLAIKNSHKELKDFKAKVILDNRNAGQFNLSPLERSLVSSYNPQVAALMREVMIINSNHLTSDFGNSLDF